LHPEKREKEIFLQKKFLFLSGEPPAAAGLFREKTKIFLQKIFVFSLFGFKIVL
jgi:hypothetical protein